MKHQALPQTMTPEALAEWIKNNHDGDIVNHIEKTELDEQMVKELEHKSSLASRAIDRLEAVKKEFMDILTNGTPNEEEPFDVTIPPTKGLKILKANREFADKQLENGYSEETIPLYMIPYPEESQMLAFDIEGNEWPEYTKDMTDDQVNKHKPMLKKSKKQKEVNFLDEPAQEELDL